MAGSNMPRKNKRSFDDAELSEGAYGRQSLRYSHKSCRTRPRSSGNDFGEAECSESPNKGLTLQRPTVSHASSCYAARPRRPVDKSRRSNEPDSSDEFGFDYYGNFVRKPRFDLMRLPKKLRMKVYEHLLQPEHLKVHSIGSLPQHAGRLKARHDAEFDGNNPVYYGVSHLEQRRRPLYTAILETCEQVYVEARPVLYRPKKLELTLLVVGSNTKRYQQFLSRHIFQPNMLYYIFWVETLQLRFFLWAGSSSKMLAHWQHLTESINSDKLLAKRIMVSISTRSTQRTELPTKEQRARAVSALIAIFGLVKQALRRACVFAEVQIEMSESWGTMVTWKMERRGEWEFEMPDEFPTGFETDNIDKYAKLIEAAKGMFRGQVSQ